MSQQRGQTATPYYTPTKPPVSTPPATNMAGYSKPSTVLPPGKMAPAHSRLSARLWRQASTTLRGQFIVLASACMLLALVLALYSALSFQRAADDLNTIANGSIPSVDAAQAMAQYIDDIDAKAADYLATAGLTDKTACVLPGLHQPVKDGMQTVHDCDNATLNAEIVLANQQLFNAAHNVTYPGEQTAVERITEGFEEYNGHLAVMMHEFALANGSTDPTNEHFKLAYQAYQAATSVLHTRIQRPVLKDEANLPDCTTDDAANMPPNVWVNGSLDTNISCLSTINHTHLHQAYDDTNSFLGWTVALSIIFCFLGCGLFAFTMLRMALITHRVINVGLTLAVVGGLIFSIIVMSLFGSLAGRHGVYGQMVMDDYDSVYYAAQMNRYGTDANADESRWLIALTFNDQSDSTGANRWQADWQANLARVHDLMNRAHTNQTWNEEIQPLSDMDAGWQKYETIDGQIRAAANDTSKADHLLTAEKLSTGASNAAYGTFADAVTRLSQANYDHYNSTLNATQGTLQTYIWLSALLFPLLGILAVWGVSQRLKEF